MEIDTINSNLSDVQGRFAVVSGTLPSTTNSNVSFDAPTGFTHANCICIGKVYQNTNGTWYTLPDSVASIPYVGRIIYTSNSTYNGRPYNLIFYKFG